MSLKYVVYQCDTCGRLRETTLSADRPDPIRCNITQSCRGKFTRVAVNSNKQFLVTPIVPGVTDYTPRGFDKPFVEATSAVGQVPIVSGPGNLLALSAVGLASAGDDDQFVVVDTTSTNFVIDQQFSVPHHIQHRGTITLSFYEVTPEILSFKQYTYNIKGEAQVISGNDNSQEGKKLRFTSSNQVRVFVNGVELTSGQFDRTVDNQITLTPAIFSANNTVEVLVYNDLAATISAAPKADLVFNTLSITQPNELALREASSWGDYNSVTINGAERLLLFCTDLSSLGTDKSYKLAEVTASSGLVADVRRILTTHLNIVLGKEPFTFSDKELYAYLPVSALANGATLSYQTSLTTGELQLVISADQIVQTMDQLVPGIQLIKTASAASVAVTASSTGSGSETLKRNYIKGPS